MQTGVIKMSKDLNQCQFIGNITKDLALKFMPNGTGVLNFSIACNDDYKKDGQDVKQCNFIDLVAFGKPAELIGQYCGKGSKLYASGKQRTRKWQHSDGSDRYSTEVVISDFQFLDGATKPVSNDKPNVPTGVNAVQPNPNAAADDFNDMIPF